jgi:hypothetical protein
VDLAMKYLKRHRERETIFPAVIGYNRLLSDNEPTHKFLKEIGRGHDETNCEQLIRFTERFLQDLCKVDTHSYRKLFDTLRENKPHVVTRTKDEELADEDMQREICRRIKGTKFEN